MAYRSCIFYNGNHGICGPFLPRTAHSLTSIASLNNDVANHAADLKIPITLSESQLVLNRSILTEVPEGAEICPKHRYRLGINWRPSNICMHPKHSDEKKTVSCLRSCGYELCSKLAIPLGSLICTKCRKAETATATTAAEQNINSTTPSTSGTRQGHVGPHVSTPRFFRQPRW